MNRIVINGDQAHLYSHPKSVPKGQSQFSCIQFEFSSEWDNLTKIAQFQDSSNKRYNVEVSGDVCFCPSELELGSVFVRVKGYPKDSESPVIATANEICLIVVQWFQSGGQPPVPPTPDLYQKLIEQFKLEATVPIATHTVPGKVKPSKRDFSIDKDGTLAALIHMEAVEELPEDTDPDTLYLVFEDGPGEITV